MQSSSERLPLCTATGPEVAGRLGKKRPLETSTSTGSHGAGPLKKRWSTMASEATSANAASESASAEDKASDLQKKASAAGFNPLDLLSEISATAVILERKGDPLAHYMPYTLNNVPEEEETARAALAAAPAHLQLKSQIIRRRQQLARLQNVCGYQNPSAAHEDIKLPSWQHIPAPAAATKVVAADAKPTSTPQVETASKIKTATTATETASTKTLIHKDDTVMAKILKKEAPTKKKTEKTKSKPKTAWKKKLASAESKKEKTPAAAPKREYNYQPLGGRSYCWM